MKDISHFTKVYVANQAADFRKQSKGLALTVKHSMNLDPLMDKAIFVFFNKKKDAIRMLYWDQTGFAMWGKALEKARYRWQYSKDVSFRQLIAKELRLLLQGVDINKIKFHEKVTLDELS